MSIEVRALFAKSPNALLPALTILAVWTAFWWPVISGDTHLYIRDLTLFAAPMKHYMMARFALGELPLWSPHVSGGIPFLSDPSNQVLYPPNVIYFFFSSVERAASMSAVLHSLLGMCAFAGLCRVLGVSRWIATWSAVIYGLSGYFLSIGDNVNFLPAVAWVPLAMAVYQLGLKRQRYRYSALTALCLSFLVLAGDPQNAVVLVAVLGLLSVMAIWFGASEHDRRGAARFSCVHLALTLGLAISITAAQVLPTLDMVSASVRHSGLGYKEIGLWSFPFARVLEFFQPYLFGSRFPTFDLLAPDLYPSKSEPWANSVYLGTIPVVLALVGAVAARKERAVWPVVFIVALLMSFGANAPYHELIVKYVPFIGTQRYPEKFIFWVTVAACVLASFGAQRFFDHRRFEIASEKNIAPITKFAVGIGAIAVVYWLCAYLPARTWFWNYALLELNFWQVRMPFSLNHLNVLLIHTVLMLGIIFAWIVAKPTRRGVYLAVMLVVAGLDLFWIHSRTVPLLPAGLASLDKPFALRNMAPPSQEYPYRVFYDHESPGSDIRYLQGGPLNQVLADNVPKGTDLIGLGYPHLYGFLFRRDRLHPNGGIIQGVQYLNGASAPLEPAANALFKDYLLSRDPFKFTTMANARYVVTGIEPENPAWNDGSFATVERDPARNLRVLENRQWLPRVLLVPNAIGTDDDLESIHAGLDEIEDPRSHVTIVSDVGPVTDQPPVDTPLSVRRSSPERYEISGSSPYARAYLLLNESYVGDWKATVNGQSVEVLRANLRFVAIPMEAGPFEVNFEYKPRRFWIGVAISGFGLLLCAAIVVYPVIHHHIQGRENNHDDQRRRQNFARRSRHHDAGRPRRHFQR